MHSCTTIKLISMFNHFYCSYPTLCQLYNSTTIPLNRFDDKTIPTTPVFDGDFQRIEGTVAKAKKVSHNAEGVIVVGWRRKVRAICSVRMKFNSAGQLIDFCVDESSSACRWDIVIWHKRMLSIDQSIR